MKSLVLGGARSGKSRHAEKILLDSGKPRVYIATAQALDTEMTTRIAHHQQSRGDSWQTIEEPLFLAQCLNDLATSHPKAIVLIDCMTLWLSNCLAASCWERQRKEFIECIATLSMDIVIVSNEVGSGVVPLGQLSRTFVDESGRLHQELAQYCDRVELVVAGLPLTLK